ncbi:MAG TPA: DUF2147 domain-containing protein [Bacteroidia bacterium]|nr:DUF2147 domain-containing protein [Sphingobacteriales bacterium]HPD65741.1 DUF2147 domain-containing protein [Bacteroidia bacterium]HRS59356.1 DUF2147 domain-containing protein [Bacteroidia bacterium]HRU69053.1 DUF2147 domain-containing protein [Bacteroidia bacterium]
MQKNLILSILLIMSWLFIKAQDFTEADKVRGIWFTEDNKSTVEIYRAKNGKYYGKITWLKNPLEEDGTPKVDDQNPDPSKRKEPLIGLLILKGFEYRGNGIYKDGTIYDPDNGKTYSCIMTLTDINHLDIRGYIGISLIGRTTEWVRKKQ